MTNASELDVPGDFDAIEGAENIVTRQRRTASTMFWVIAALSLLWNAGGALDYTMTQIGHAGYMSGFSPEQTAYFVSFPAWYVAFWALGVWGSFIGSVLLLLRSRHAVTAFAVSLAGVVATTAATLVLDMPDSLNSIGYWLFAAAILLITVFLLRYSLRCYRRSVIA